MSENESMPPIPPENPEPEELTGDRAPSFRLPSGERVGDDGPKPARKRRWRRFFLRHLPLTIAGGAVLLTLVAFGLYLCVSSALFENLVRKHLIREIETATGGRAEISSFHWNLLLLDAEADGLVIHGLEAPGEAPYARAERLRVQVSVLGFFSPKIQLRELEVLKPQLHLIVYPNGSTNQPVPRKQQKPGKPKIESLFDLKAGQVEVKQGVLDYDDRASAFDFQDRHIPLDFAASDVSLRMIYLPAVATRQESYRIEAGARDLNLARGPSSKPGKKQPQPVQGFVQATLDLTRNAATLESLRITARSRGVKDRTLNISGSLDDFARPRWQAKATGEPDLRLVERGFQGQDRAARGVVA